MATIKPSYGSRTSITITLDSLANGSVATSNAVDNSSNLYQDALIEIYIDGTAATTAWLEVRLLPSEDNSNFGTWESGIPIGNIPLAVDLQRAFFGCVNNILTLPKYWKLAVKNNTGASLAASGNVAYYQGINMTVV
jgi:hypothetical protein